MLALKARGHALGFTTQTLGASTWHCGHPRRPKFPGTKVISHSLVALFAGGSGGNKGWKDASIERLSFMLVRAFIAP
jgi:hypothetical protein